MEILKKYYHLITAGLVFIIYIITLAPTVIQIDSGELSAVQANLGIAHPTGYPLFTLTGYIFSLIPMPFSKIYQLNLLAALWCAAGVLMFAITANLLLENLSSFQPAKKISEKKTVKKNKGKTSPASNGNESSSPESSGIPGVKKIIAIAGGSLILAFSETFWFQSTSVEVYSLHIFLIILIIYFLIKAYLKKDNDLKDWLIYSAALALGFTNHMTTLLILPGTAYLYFIKHGINKPAFKRIGIMLLVFFPVLILVYAYLPIRASQSPLINWGNPIDFERILRHISGKQYQVWLFSSTEAAKKQLGYFIDSLPSEFNISLFFCLFGIISSYLMGKKLFAFLLITFASAVLYSINYDIVDIDSYFLLAYITLSLFAVFGIVKILSLVKFTKNTYAISAGLVGIFIILQFYFNFGKVNQSNTYTFEDYTKALINSTEKNSFIFSYQWDYFVSASYYFQNVEGFRKDVGIIDKELLRRSWYYHQIETVHPQLIAGIKSEKEMFFNAIKPFERDEEFNSTLLESLYQRIMTNLVGTNIVNRNVYIGPELFENEMQKKQFSLPDGYTIVPDLLLFKVVKGNKYVPAANPDFTIRFPKNRNHYTDFIEYLVGSMLVRRALYEMQFDKRDRAKIYIQKVKNDFPGYTIPQGLEPVLGE